MIKALPRVVLVGRINAGKSTLFNTLSETGKAIVSSTPGTTRDLNYADISWRDKSFTLIDTGGLDAGQLGKIEDYVQKKAFQAISKASLVLFVIDGKKEITYEDKKIARQLTKSKQKVMLVVNKIDGSKARKNLSPDIYKLGFEEPALVSAISGVGTGDLLDKIAVQVPERSLPQKNIDLKLSIIGKTNVGKSSILNAILGTEHVLVTPHPHTTREPQDITLTYNEKNIVLVDTAGLRKKRKMADEIEKNSAQRTLETIKKSDVSLMVVDISQNLSSQDQAIAQLAAQRHNGIIIVGNKWDLISDKSQISINRYTKYLQRYFPQFDWAPIIFISALHKQRTGKLINLALKIQNNRQQQISQNSLDVIFSQLILKKAKPSKDKKAATLKGLKQTDTSPPAFKLYADHPDRINPAFLKQVEKKLRQQFDFSGTPIILNI